VSTWWPVITSNFFSVFFFNEWTIGNILKVDTILLWYSLNSIDKENRNQLLYVYVCGLNTLSLGEEPPPYVN